MNSIELMFLDKSIKRGGVVSYPKKDALDFVKECRNQSIRILGIDGFYITETYTQPSLEDSVDYSRLEANVVYDLAIAFLKDRPDELYFEIVCDE